MLQALVRKGGVTTHTVPAPVVSDGAVLIRVSKSCISAGTELYGVEMSGRSILSRAVEQPQRVGKALSMVKDRGMIKTVTLIRSKYDKSMPTGYSVCGMVLAVGRGVTDFVPGDIVAAAGAGRANHAEYVDVPENLAVKLPQGLDQRAASSVAIGSTALQGTRKADLKLGEFALVFGAGILGLITIQILRASGVRVAAVDIDPRRIELARVCGAEQTLNGKEPSFITDIVNWSGGYGVDAVLFTAATLDSTPLSQSFTVCKKQGKVVMIGVSGMNINREDMYAKELELTISSSYGPGRYDRTYEEKGLDYPYAFVRWTEKRNMAEYLRLLHSSAVNIDSMIERVYPIEKAGEAFEALQSADPKPLIVVLDYGSVDPAGIEILRDHDRRVFGATSIPSNDGQVGVAVVGLGGFAMGVHLPNLVRLKDKYKLIGLMSHKGATAKAAADRFGAVFSTTKYEDILSDDRIGLVLIATRHDSHADLALKALEAGKNVFVEKPMAVSEEEIAAYSRFYENRTGPLLFTGFNRRFSHYAQVIKKAVAQRVNPLVIHYRMNAGFIPPEHWVHENGGRIVGEACHIIDLFTFLTGAKLRSVSFESISPSNNRLSPADNVAMLFKYEDGSVATLHYFANGSPSLSKEYMEVHFDGKSAILDNYHSLTGYGVPVKPVKTATGKGQLEELLCLHDALTGKSENWPIALWDMLQTTETAMAISRGVHILPEGEVPQEEVREPMTAG